MRLKATLAALLLATLAACAGDQRPRAYSQPVTAVFVAGKSDEILVTILDRQPAGEIVLVAADGTRTEAYRVDRTRTAAGSNGGIPIDVGVGVAGGSSGGVSTGIGIGFPILGSDGSNQPDEHLTRAYIKISDLEAYRALYRNFRIAMVLGPESGLPRQVEIPAPPPPLAP